MSLDDKSTWNTERFDLPGRKYFDAAEFAPKAWRAIRDVCGGEDRVAAASRWWSDNFIVNLGKGEATETRPQDLTEWHVDGDFFVRYLDSPEQGLLVVPLFTDIQAGGGDTILCPGTISIIARHLHANPDGVSQQFTPRAENPAFDVHETSGFQWFRDLVQGLPDEAFVEATGKVGDVYLIHPFLVHSFSQNRLRTLRIITNTRICIEAPLDFNRVDRDYSLVERKILDALRVDSLDWTNTHPRQTIVPKRLRLPRATGEDERERLEALEWLNSLAKSAPIV